MLFACLPLCCNSTSLEDKQNGVCRADRLAPVATAKPLLFTQHKACGGCGATEKLCDWWMISGCIWCTRMSSTVWHDKVRESAFFWPLNLKRPAQLNKGYQIHSSVPSGVNSTDQPTDKDMNRKKYYILSCLRKTKHTHNHWLQLTENRSSIMWNLKAWPADYGDSDPCIHADTVTKRGAAFACGQGWLALPIVLTN